MPPFNICRPQVAGPGRATAGRAPGALQCLTSPRVTGLVPRQAVRGAAPRAQGGDSSGAFVSEAERFIQTVGAEGEEHLDVEVPLPAELQGQHAALLAKVAGLQSRIDGLYAAAFSGVALPAAEEAGEGEEPLQLPDLSSLDEAGFGELGRTHPRVVQALIGAKERSDPQGWRAFQAEANSLKLQRSRAEKEAASVLDALAAAERAARNAANPSDYESMAGQWDAAARSGGAASTSAAAAAKDRVRVVLITGFESFNVDLYKKAAVELAKQCPAVSLRVFSDRDIGPRRAEVEAALDGADVFFGSLLFDFDQVEWLRGRISQIPLRLVFESALELMGSTQVGSFQMGAGGQSKGPPPAVKKVLSLFGSGREEDKMVGYLSFLKVGPKLLKFLPGQKVKDLRTWLTVYSYWNQGGLQNVVSMFLYLVRESFTLPAPAPPPAEVVETPATGLLHPARPGHYFGTPGEYLEWYGREGPLRDDRAAPTVALLLYRKHVITEQPYVPELIARMEAEGLRPLPIFINGVEGHTVVRDALTTAHEQALLRRGGATSPTLKSDAVLVDAVVNTIGFPLVGGPAGTMEGGRQADVAKAILASKNVPYVVAAPLLIQDMASWVADGVAGLQSVVLYSLPELDGAIDTVPLGGLVGDNIHLVPERVTRLASRLRKWISLRRTPAAERRLAILLYGFPPGVGATGTAALLNVPKSLERLLATLRAEGYDLGPSTEAVDGEALVAALKLQEDQRAILEGAEGIKKRGAGAAELAGVSAAAADVSPSRLRDMLTYPSQWGPTEWGPIPFLPDNDVLVRRLERQWGELGSYRGLATSARGDAVVSGLQLGNVWIGVQPALGVEGDPMRLLFERDLTPHPQYAAFYKWLQHDYNASAVVHFGMHGTVEWLPGAPLGNSGFSWSDVLLGDLPNVYVYAANNPSESIVAKRRGYGTIVSHNVPPYGRAGLYKQLAELKALVGEYREEPGSNAALKAPIVELLRATGLQEDCPFDEEAAAAGQPVELTSEAADSVPEEAFAAYASRLYTYLQVVEGRIFSEGLHVLGQPPTASQASQYLSAYFGDGLPAEAVRAVAEGRRDEGLQAVRSRLERIFAEAEAEAGPGSSGGGAGSTSAVAAAAAAVDGEKLEEAVRIRGLLDQNGEELTSIVRALNGEYILPEAGGDLLRDGAGVLPTGRNIHALDPYRMPSLAALDRGTRAAEAILQTHRDANGGAWPETVAVNLWGLDSIKTKGESVAIVLCMLGARPVKEGTGRISRFELIPLEELGRPRVDVLCNMSGIFRDSFQNVVELLDDSFQRAASAAGEPEEMNYVKKHAAAMAAAGLTNPGARLFSNPAGDYGSMVNERVGASSWESGDELGDTWASRNAFSYGRGGERGTARPEVLQALLKTTDRVVQEVDSVEYGLTDIQEYYANTGALTRAAQVAKGPGAKRVACSVVEAFSKEVRPRELEEVLRLEYRSKLLNPKWAEAMAAQGSGGAFEISQRMTAMLGWGATVDFKEDWTWDQAADTYALDPEMAAKLKAANPEAFANVLKRMLEAAGRGIWDADESTLEALRAQYAEMDDQLEGVTGPSRGR